MNKSLLLAALSLVSASAFASKARLTALQSAAHLSDVQAILVRPDSAAIMPEFATMEFGTPGSASGSSSTTVGQALGSGGFVRKIGDSAYGAYLGNRAVAQNDYRGYVGDTNLLGTENALNLVYATKLDDLTLGAGIYYSASSRKPDLTTSVRSQDATSLIVSATGKGSWDTQLTVGISNNAKYNDTATTEKALAGKTSYRLSAGYELGSAYGFAAYEGGGATFKNSTATLNDFGKSVITLGIVDSMKKDGTEFFYGVSYVMTSIKDDGSTVGTAISTKTETAKLPLIVGLESDVASWLTVRGSITQSILVDTKKVTSGTTIATNDSGASDTTVAAGLGLKFGKLTMDGTLAAATSATGTFGADGTNFLASTAFTYMF